MFFLPNKSTCQYYCLDILEEIIRVKYEIYITGFYGAVALVLVLVVINVFLIVFILNNIQKNNDGESNK